MLFDRVATNMIESKDNSLSFTNTLRVCYEDGIITEEDYDDILSGKVTLDQILDERGY